MGQWLAGIVAFESVRIDRCHRQEAAVRSKLVLRAHFGWDDDRTLAAAELAHDAAQEARGGQPPAPPDGAGVLLDREPVAGSGRRPRPEGLLGRGPVRDGPGPAGNPARAARRADAAGPQDGPGRGRGAPGGGRGPDRRGRGASGRVPGRPRRLGAGRRATRRRAGRGRRAEAVAAVRGRQPAPSEVGDGPDRGPPPRAGQGRGRGRAGGEGQNPGPDAGLAARRVGRPARASRMGGFAVRSRSRRTRSPPTRSPTPRPARSRSPSRSRPPPRWSRAAAAPVAPGAGWPRDAESTARKRPSPRPSPGGRGERSIAPSPPGRGPG